MSFFDKAFDNITNPASNGLKEIGGKLFDEVNPQGTNSLDNLSMVNAMRGGSALPEGFPQLGEIFSSSLPEGDFLKQLPTEFLSKIPSAGPSITDSTGAFTGLANLDGMKDILGGANPFGNLFGGERSFFSALESAPQMLSENAYLGKSIPGTEEFSKGIESTAADIATTGDITGMSGALGGDALGGVLGSLGLDGIAGGPGGLLGSLSGLLGEGGIGSLIGSVTDIIGKILPLIAKLAPLALAII